MEHRLILDSIYRMDITMLDSNTTADITKEVKLNCQFTIRKGYGVNGIYDDAVLHEGYNTIKGRGNSTWLAPKRPYAFVSTDSAFKKLPMQLLDMPADYDWVLLADYYDKTFWRNTFAFRCAWAFGMEWAPRSRKVELYINGDYQGLYTFCEKIKAAPNRVNIVKMSKTDNEGEAVTGGYIIEKDNYTPEPGEAFFNDWWHSALYTFKEPDGKDVTPEQLAYIVADFYNVAVGMYNVGMNEPNSYHVYADRDSFARHMLAQDFVKNNDAYSGSWYTHKDRNGKYKMGPVWDFDNSLGSRVYAPWSGLPVDFTDPNDTWVSKKDPYTNTFLRRDPVFAQMCSDIFKERAGFLNDLIADLEVFIPRLIATGAVDRDRAKWPDVLTAADLIPMPSYQAECDRVMKFITDRMYWHTRRIYDVLPAKAIN